MAFLVLCAPKALESDPEHHHLHARHARAQELQEELTSLLEPDAVQELAKKGLQLQVREGGVAAALGPAPSSSTSSNGDEHNLSQHARQQQTSVWIAGRDERIAVFQGHLKNLKELEAKYLPDTSTSAAPHHHHHHPDAPPEHMPPVPETAPAPPEDQQIPPKRANGHGDAHGPNGSSCSGGGGNPAAVLLAMYEAMGASLLGHLQGRFAMCMFDAVQMRVLAARDGSGAVPLLQSRTPRGGMVLSSCADVLACCHDTLEFAPGFFKYGWLAAPRLFTPQALQHPTSGHNTPRRSLDLQHHPHHHHSHHHHKENGGASANGSRRASMDHATPPGSAGRGNGGASSAQKPPGGGKGSRRASLDHGTSTPPLSGQAQGQGQQGSRRCSTDAGAAPPLPHSAGRSREGGGQVGRGAHSPTRSTSSSGSAGNGHPPTGRRRPAAEAPHSGGASGVAVGAATAGLSHLRVEAAPFVPGAAAGK